MKLDGISGDLYGVIPHIIYRYGAEALNSAGKFVQAKEKVNQGLNLYPDSIPLKVYEYLNTKDEILKRYLIENHANHWLVRENGIK